MATLTAIGTAIAANAGTIGTAATIGGTALSAYQGAQAARAQSKVYQQQADLEKSAARREEILIQERNRKLLAAQQAKFAKAGVTGAGTPASLLKTTAQAGQGDILATRFSGESAKRRKLGQSSLAKQEATGQLIGGATSIGKTLLSRY